MLIAAVNDNLDKALFLGHVVALVVAFAPAVVHPILIAKTKGDGDEGAFLRLAGHMAGNGRQIHFPALVVLGAFGLAMVFTSDDLFGFDDTWVSLALLVWLGICGVISGLVLPNERKLAAGDLSAERLVERGGQIATLLFLVMLYLMIWKPGA
ncbi:MAG: hypothetical protein ABIX10_05795 [Acidimicrobiales bacterium]